ncbi:MAG: hypothetical protein ACJ791_00765 [Gemmatimonadaceae bacterium]
MRGTLARTNLSFLAAVTLIASGCASLRPYDPGPGMRVAASVVHDTYVSGAPVNVTIANLSEVTLFYPDGFCKTRLQKKDRGGWLTVSDPSKPCPVELGFLEPGQAVVHQFRLPEGVPDGIYRFALPMPVPDEAAKPEPELITPIFKVERGVLTTASGPN